jgi:hypothetical protein
MNPATLSLFLFLLAAPAWGQLRILVVQGDGQRNDIHQRANPEIVLEVSDENGKPVEGASVVFALPSQGPGGTFENGTRTLTTSTDRNGRASAFGIRPNQLTGAFTIRATASYQGKNASAAIAQSNVAASTSASSKGKKIAIIVGLVGGAAAAGILVATHAGGGSSSSSSTIVLTPGTPTIGAPK